MIERCKHIGKDGFRCGSHAFNLYKDDIEQDDLCDVHYWQAKAQRTWEGLSVFEINDLVESTEYEDYQDLVERTEAKLKEKNT